MRHVAAQGPVHLHGHGLHELAAGAGKLIHRPAFWVMVAVLLMVAVVVALTLIQGVPSQPGPWDTYMWMPY